MDWSYVALERIAQDAAAQDPGIQQTFDKMDRPFRSVARKMSDEQLLAKLKENGLELDRDGLLEITRLCVSAEAASIPIADKLPKWKEGKSIPDFRSDWLWIGISVLWERWFPETPNFEMLDDAIREGYDFQCKDLEACVAKWNKAWDMIEILADRIEAQSIDEFDHLFSGTQTIGNWMGDYSMEIVLNTHNYERFIAVGESFKRHFPEPHDHDLIEGDLAIAYHRSGQVTTSEPMFQRLAENSGSAWDWLRWARAYTWVDGDAVPDYKRAEEILRIALQRPNLEDAEYLFTELDEFDNIHSQSRNARHGDLPAGNKVGRNDPCPCGSGSKYKKCCG